VAGERKLGHLSSQELRTRSQQVREGSKQLKAEGEILSARAENAIKRSIAARAASQLAMGRSNYIIKKCGCGKHYDILEWFELPFAGYQETELLDGEMRHCSCKSTLLFITRREAA